LIVIRGQRRRHSPLEVGEELCEVLNALRRKGDGRYIVDVPDREAAIFRLHVHRNIVEKLLIFAK
jgi:hypothetical protein